MAIEFENKIIASNKVNIHENSSKSLDHLINLLQDKNLAEEKIKQEAKELGVDSYKLCFRIIEKLKLNNSFFNYCKNITKEESASLSREEILFNFFKKIQQPDKIEQEPQMPDVSTTSVSPATLPADEPQPDVVPLQVPEIPNLEPSPAPEIIPSAQSAENITNPERKNWWEVKRETEVMAVEDLDGSMEMFEKHVAQLGAAKKDASGHWQWTGDNKKLVFLGDILGDRGMDGMKITSIIGNLSEQAEKKDGQVDFLCGNHDIAIINFLCRYFSDDVIKEKAEIIASQYAGILELVQFDSELNSKFKETKFKKFGEHTKEILLELNKKIPNILENMKTDPGGLEMLENICKIKAMVVYDDTLYCHTDPTSAMVADLTKNENIAQRVLEINKIFQENIRESLFNGMKLGDDFRKIEETYFDTNNRIYFVEENSFDGIADNLYERLDMKADDSVIEKNIEEWKNENGIKEDCVSDIRSIISELNNGNQEEARKLHNSLFEKIKKGFIEKVKYSGINAIIHGHSPQTDRYYDENDLIIISPHALFQNNGSNHENGISIIKTNGRINLFGKSFRKQKPTASLSQKPLAPNNKPAKQEQKKEAISNSMKKMAELFSDSKLSSDVIKEEAAKNQMKPSELAVQFIEGSGNLKWQFRLRLNSLFHEGIKDDEAIEMVAMLMILEGERNKLQEIIRTKSGDNLLRLRLEEITVSLKKLTKEIYKKQDEVEKF